MNEILCRFNDDDSFKPNLECKQELINVNKKHTNNLGCSISKMGYKNNIHQSKHLIKYQLTLALMTFSLGPSMFSQ